MKTILLLLLLLLLCAVSIMGAAPKLKIACSHGDQSTCINDILNAQSIVESNNNQNAIGDTFSKNNYSVGLHQIRLKSAIWITNRLIKNKYKRTYIKNSFNIYGVETTLKDKYINRYIAKTYLLWLYKQHNNWNDAIISYNTGLHAKIDVRNRSKLNYLSKIIYQINKMVP